MSKEIKAIEQATILTIFNDSISVGHFLTVAPIRAGQPPLMTGEPKRCYVSAKTTAYWIEKLKYGLVVQFVGISDGDNFLPKTHAYRALSSDTPRITPMSGYYNSGMLLRKVVQMADAFKAEMEPFMPEGILGESDSEAPAPVDAGETFAGAVLDSVAAQVNAGALNSNGVTVTASVSKGARGRRK